MFTIQNTLQSFFNAVHEGRYSAAVKAKTKGLSFLTTYITPEPRTDLPILDEIPGMLENSTVPHLEPLAADLEEVVPLLKWSTFYERNNLTQGFIGQFAVAELAGPNGPVIANKATIGLFVMGANTYYPLHWHAASEVYFVLCGHPWFMVGDNMWKQKQAGDAVRVPGNVPHAISNENEPMLVMYIWRGKVRKKPIFPVDSGNHPAHLVNAEMTAEFDDTRS
ncbi:MAG: dimethylsulfonioproprionate lyase family protein [Chloroflexota bacterium]